MFAASKFNRDISKWNVSNAKNIEGMFAKSKFTRDISNWGSDNVRRAGYTFNGYRGSNTSIQEELIRKLTSALKRA